MLIRLFVFSRLVTTFTCWVRGWWCHRILIRFRTTGSVKMTFPDLSFVDQLVIGVVIHMLYKPRGRLVELGWLS